MRLLTAAILAAGLSVTSAAEAEIRLRTTVQPTGDTVTLGDLFEGLNSKADTVVAPAPPPGMKTTYQIKHIAALARIHDLDWRPEGGERPVVIAHASRRFMLRDVLASIEAEIRARGFDGAHDIDLSGRQIGPGFEREGVSLDLHDVDFDPASGQFSALLTIRALNGGLEQTPVSGQVRTELRVPVVHRLVRRGEAISREDIDWITLRTAPDTRNLVESADELIGQAARRTLRPGAPIKLSDLTAPTVVHKGSIVTMVLRAPGLLLTGTGRALEDAALGEAVKIMNPQSKRTVEATVVGPDQVRVTLRRQVAVAASQ